MPETRKKISFTPSDKDWTHSNDKTAKAIHASKNIRTGLTGSLPYSVILLLLNHLCKKMNNATGKNNRYGNKEMGPTLRDISPGPMKEETIKA
jgi:hypothetical protein